MPTVGVRALGILDGSNAYECLRPLQRWSSQLVCSQGGELGFYVGQRVIGSSCCGCACRLVSSERWKRTRPHALVLTFYTISQPSILDNTCHCHYCFMFLSSAAKLAVEGAVGCSYSGGGSDPQVFPQQQHAAPPLFPLICAHFLIGLGGNRDTASRVPPPAA